MVCHQIYVMTSLTLVRIGFFKKYFHKIQVVVFYTW